MILTRERHNGETELLLGRRSGGHVFMPQKYVFPGGRVDRRDGFAPLAREPGSEVMGVLTRVLTERRARAAAAASIRETAEETGLLLAEPRPIEKPSRDWAPFAEAGAAPTAAPLQLVTRAITPPGRPRRFDAFFFRADAEHLHGSTALAGSGELEDLRWVSLDDAHGLDIPMVTRFVLGELSEHLKGKAPIRWARPTRSGLALEEL
ncbi:NUDIX hydrolase [Marinicauda pacifica]|uniref:NUDIX hydrolase n=1 Tax=Marinicauda pacifica TaxID=1133559 RepID=UPI001F2BA275|nr:NUDIX hydrolase [Marinicauda pacifica]